MLTCDVKSAGYQFGANRLQISQGYGIDRYIHRSGVDDRGSFKKILIQGVKDNKRIYPENKVSVRRAHKIYFLDFSELPLA